MRSVCGKLTRYPEQGRMKGLGCTPRLLFKQPNLPPLLSPTLLTKLSELDCSPGSNSSELYQQLDSLRCATPALQNPINTRFCFLIQFNK